MAGGRALICLPLCPRFVSTGGCTPVPASDPRPIPPPPYSLRGAPFEASKRHWVVPLLYAVTAPLVTGLALTGGRLAAIHRGVGTSVARMRRCRGCPPNVPPPPHC